jgi:hypothetical protein
MSLRAEAGELPASLVEWWEAFQRGDQAEREALINEAKNSGATNRPRSAAVVAPAIAAVPRPVEERLSEPGLCRSGKQPGATGRANQGRASGPCCSCRHHVLAHSSLYLTTPVGYLDQPDFINAVAQLDTA